MAIPQKSRIDTESASYMEYGAKNDYHNNRGLIVCPVAGRTAGHRVIQLHGGFGTRTVRWKAKRAGAPPVIPAAANTAGDTLLSEHVMPFQPIPDEKGGYDWLVTGEYTFVQNAPRVAGINAFPAGEFPFMTPQGRIAEQIVGLYGASIISQTPLTREVVDLFTEYATTQTYRTEGVPVWPFTVLPAAASSTHIIGG